MQQPDSVTPIPFPDFPIIWRPLKDDPLYFYNIFCVWENVFDKVTNAMKLYFPENTKKYARPYLKNFTKIIELLPEFLKRAYDSGIFKKTNTFSEFLKFTMDKEHLFDIMGFLIGYIDENLLDKCKFLTYIYEFDRALNNSFGLDSMQKFPINNEILKGLSSESIEERNAFGKALLICSFMYLVQGVAAEDVKKNFVVFSRSYSTAARFFHHINLDNEYTHIYSQEDYVRRVQPALERVQQALDNVQIASSKVQKASDKVQTALNQEQQASDEIKRYLRSVPQEKQGALIRAQANLRKKQKNLKKAQDALRETQDALREAQRSPDLPRKSYWVLDEGRNYADFYMTLLRRLQDGNGAFNVNYVEINQYGEYQNIVIDIDATKDQLQGIVEMKAVDRYGNIRNANCIRFVIRLNTFEILTAFPVYRDSNLPRIEQSNDVFFEKLKFFLDMSQFPGANRIDIRRTDDDFFNTAD